MYGDLPLHLFLLRLNTSIGFFFWRCKVNQTSFEVSNVCLKASVSGGVTAALVLLRLRS